MMMMIFSHYIAARLLIKKFYFSRPAHHLENGDATSTINCARRDSALTRATDALTTTYRVASFQTNPSAAPTAGDYIAVRLDAGDGLHH